MWYLYSQKFLHLLLCQSSQQIKPSEFLLNNYSGKMQTKPTDFTPVILIAIFVILATKHLNVVCQSIDILFVHWDYSSIMTNTVMGSTSLLRTSDISDLISITMVNLIIRKGNVYWRMIQEMSLKESFWQCTEHPRWPRERTPNKSSFWDINSQIIDILLVYELKCSNVTG